MSRWGILSTARINDARRSTARARRPTRSTSSRWRAAAEPRAQAYADAHGHPARARLLRGAARRPRRRRRLHPAAQRLHVDWAVRALRGRQARARARSRWTAARRARSSRRSTSPSARGSCSARRSCGATTRRPRRLRELLDEGAIGEVRLVRACFSFPLAGDGDVRLDAGARRRGAHGRRLLLRQRRAAASRGEPVSVSAQAVTARRRRHALRRRCCASTATCWRRSTAASTSPARDELEVVGSEGRIVLADPWHGREPRHRAASAAPSARSSSSSRPNSYRLELEDIGRGDPRAGARRCSAATTRVGQARAIEALYRSAAEGRAVPRRDERRPARRDRGLRAGRRGLPRAARRRDRRARARRGRRRPTPSAPRGRGPRTPASHVAADADELLRDVPDLDLLVVATPNRSHVPLARAALARGLAGRHGQAARRRRRRGARALVDDFAAAGVPFTVFQNRRWDGDFLTVRAARRVRRARRRHALRVALRALPPARSRERWRELRRPRRGRRAAARPRRAPRRPGARAVRPPACACTPRSTRAAPGAQVDDDVFVALEHAGGVRSHLWMSAVAPLGGRSLRVERDARRRRTTPGLDPQEDQLAGGPAAGRRRLGRGRARRGSSTTTASARCAIEPRRLRAVLRGRARRAARRGGRCPSTRATASPRCASSRRRARSARDRHRHRHDGRRQAT